MFAAHGFEVVGVDVNQDVVDALNGGDVHIEEPGLKTVVRAALNSGNLTIRTKPEICDVFIIAVPTPITNEKTADMNYVESATESIIPYLRPGNLVILEATSPPRTTTDRVQPILEQSGLEGGKDFLLAYSPERVLPGQILHELVHNSRVMGGITRESAEAGSRLYKSFVEGDIVITDATTAEMVKLMENTYRDINIAIANEFSRLTDKFKVNVWEAIEVANRHPRVEILQPGPGVGGHCISVDPWFLVEKAPKLSRLIQKAREVNDDQPGYVVELMKDDFSGLENKLFAALGVTYKPNVDDIRESPAIDVIDLIMQEGGKIKAFDPFIGRGTAKTNHMDYIVESLERAVEGVDGIILLVNHRQFSDLPVDKLANLMGSKYILDTRNTIEPEVWRNAGFRVRILGVGQ